ncbi:hypothetical protein ACMV_P7_00040 (plasmid) [Acidiphilium multivorum AIU301]|uniref:Uncharacterized protein n=1 Tax=Acidiphilium multivorum (strain DSM 11245 / JCM 8867 / NBRC 100883 / AIU 301) TaxID=926570 RepID=F0J874_ACIMA|nr:hypothetical protein ACMV_P7_00040 [Acidiphilium multivorum AIU301]GAN73556.1 hypothetical protein Apmu_0092_04 [Acidiphilium multivorum AIU301]
MTQNLNNELRLKILEKLYSIESTLNPGDSVLVQPYIDGQETTNPLKIHGYDWNQIDSTLREMCRTGLLSSGSVQYDAPAIGIYFSALTPRGRTLLGK